LNNDFTIVKKVYFPLAWKLGVAYYIYEDKELTYSLFPIEINKNDVQIKEINKILFEQMRDDGFGFIGNYAENPIKNRPKDYAYEIIEHRMERIIDNKILNHENMFLAHEYLFEFVEKFHIQLGIEIKDEYEIFEVENAFYNYLPIWVIETVKFMIRVNRNGVTKISDCLYRRPFFDPLLLIPQIMSDERTEITEIVEKNVKAGVRIPSIPLGNERYPFGMFVDFITYLKFNDVKKVTRIYAPKDYRRPGGTIYKVWSEDALKYNLKEFFNNFPKIYNEIIDKNFPSLSTELSLFTGVSRIIILYDFKFLQI